MRKTKILIAIILLGIVVSAAGMHQTDMARDVSKIVFKAAHKHNWFWTDGWFELLIGLSQQTITGNKNHNLTQLTKSFQSSREMTECFSLLGKVERGIQEQQIIENLVRVFLIRRNQAEQIVWITKSYSKIFPELSLMMKCTDQGTLCSKEAIELISDNHWYQRKEDFRRIYKKMQAEEKRYSDLSFKISEKANKLYFFFFTLFCFFVGLFFLTIIRQRNKNSQEILRESEALFRSQFELGNIGIAIASTEKSWLRVNRRICDMFGYSEEEIKKKTWAEMTYPDDLESDVVQFNRMLAGEIEVYEIDKRFVRKDGDIIWTHLAVSCFRNQDRTARFFIASISDITERLNLQETAKQTQKMEAIGTLAGGIAHDFNNILGGIIGYAELAQDDLSSDSPAQEYLKEQLKSTTRAKDLVKQILTFSRKSQEERKPILLYPIVKEAAKLLRSTIPTTIEIRQSIDETTGMVNADPTQLHQIVMNLCTNAAHSMLETEGVLEIILSPVMITQESMKQHHIVSPGPFLQLKISDTGTGIDSKIIHRIFEPFFTTKEKEKGTGMGLAVVHGIVKDHGGDISIDSQLGKGTTFTILLPQIVAEPDNDEDPMSEVPAGHEHILFVDDEKTLVDLSKKLLESLGYAVTAKNSSLEALKTFQQSPDIFDMVITDQTMPHMTGYNLAKRVLEIKPSAAVILCTGYSDSITPEKIKASGIKALIYKPISKKEIARTIREVLDKKDS